MQNQDTVTVESGKLFVNYTNDRRHFKYYMVPPLQYWNPDITFVEIKTNGGQPKISIELGYSPFIKNSSNQKMVPSKSLMLVTSEKETFC